MNSGIAGCRMTVQRIAHTLDRIGFTPRGAAFLVALVVLLALPLAIAWRLLRFLWWIA